MSQYLIAALIVFGINLLPAFGPPTWLVLVYLALSFKYEPNNLVLVAVLAAASGRYLMASLVRKYREKLPSSYVTNIENLGKRIAKNSASVWGLFVLFIWSPFSSAQMFVAAGLIRQVKILQLTIAFAIGRFFTYTAYVLGAYEFSKTDFGAAFISEMFSAKMIFVQLVLILGIVLLGKIKWKAEDSDD